MNPDFYNETPNDIHKYAYNEGLDPQYLDYEISERYPDVWQHISQVYKDLSANKFLVETGVFTQVTPFLWDLYKRVAYSKPLKNDELPLFEELNDSTYSQIAAFNKNELLPYSLEDLTLLVEHVDDSLIRDSLRYYIEIYGSKMDDLAYSQISMQQISFQLYTLLSGQLGINAEELAFFKTGLLGFSSLLAIGQARIYSNMSKNMNHVLRAGNDISALLVFKGLTNLGVSFDEAISLYMQKNSFDNDLFHLIRYINKRWASGNIEKGFLTGSAVSSFSTFELNPVLLGVFAFHFKSILGSLKKLTGNQSSVEKENFWDWFINARDRIDQLSTEALISGNKTLAVKLDQIVQDSDQMAKYIDKPNFASNFEEFAMIWFLQFASAVSSLIPEDQKAFNSILNDIGFGSFATYLTYTLLKNEQNALAVLEPLGLQSLHRMQNYHRQQHKVIEDAVLRKSSIDKILENYEFRPKLKGIHIPVLLSADNSEKATEITLNSGINFFIGESGSGKSTAINFISNVLSRLNIPNSKAPVEALSKITPGSYISSLIASFEHPLKDSEFGQYLRFNYPEFVASISPRDFHAWASEWIKLYPFKESSSGPSHEKEWQDVNNSLNFYLIKYLEEVYGIKNAANVLIHGGSKGERSRIEILCALQFLKNEYIFIDESLSSIDPENLQTFYGMLVNRANFTLENGSTPVIVICTHQNEHISHFKDRLEVESLAITKFENGFSPKTSY